MVADGDSTGVTAGVSGAGGAGNGVSFDWLSVGVSTSDGVGVDKVWTSFTVGMAIGVGFGVGLAVGSGVGVGVGAARVGAGSFAGEAVAWGGVLATSCLVLHAVVIATARITESINRRVTVCCLIDM